MSMLLLVIALRRFDAARHHLELAQRIDPFSYRQNLEGKENSCSTVAAPL
jgi:hypothetical protein